jgi:type I restriction enzyme, R subunit
VSGRRTQYVLDTNVGFDQPLLHTMYVDKRLAGVQAVQTLSRIEPHLRRQGRHVRLDFFNEAA